MKQQHVDYLVMPYSKIRRVMAISFRLSHHMPLIYGLLEVDVSRARAFLRDHKRSSRSKPRRKPQHRNGKAEGTH